LTGYHSEAAGLKRNESCTPIDRVPRRLRLAIGEKTKKKLSSRMNDNVDNRFLRRSRLTVVKIRVTHSGPDALMLGLESKLRAPTRSD
jgi:hypothetical protein